MKAKATKQGESKEQQQHPPNSGMTSSRMASHSAKMSP